LWSWLPAFRTVAETEHLPTAAQILELSASALSRSVKQLEDCLGQPLFTREGRRMQLNRAGEQLLIAVRDAMRRIDDGVEQVASRSIERIRIASGPTWLQLLVLHSHEDKFGALDIIDVEEADRPTALLRGEIDLAICERVGPNPQLVVERLGETRRVLCWSRDVSAAAAAALPFAVCTSEGVDASIRHEHIALRTTSLGLAVEACRSGRMRAVLPAAIAHTYELQTAPKELASSPVFLIQRSLLIESPIAPFIAKLKQRAIEILDQPRS